MQGWATGGSGAISKGWARCGSRRLCALGLLGLVALALIAGASSASAAEYGQCLAHKKGKYSNSGCTASSAPNKGKFEWYPGAPRACVAKKHGEYKNATCTTKASKKGKGKYEKGGPGFAGTGGFRAFADSEGRTVEQFSCGSGSTVGQVTSATGVSETITAEDCTGESAHVRYACPNPAPFVLVGELTEPVPPNPGEALTRLSTSPAGEPFLRDTCLIKDVEVTFYLTGEVDARDFTNDTDKMSRIGGQFIEALNAPEALVFHEVGNPFTYTGGIDDFIEEQIYEDEAEIRT
jgi:hypothetical protein